MLAELAGGVGDVDVLLLSHALNVVVVEVVQLDVQVVQCRGGRRQSSRGWFQYRFVVTSMLQLSASVENGEAVVSVQRDLDAVAQDQCRRVSERD